MTSLRNVRLALFAGCLLTAAVPFVASGQLTLVIWATGFHDPAVLTRYRLSTLPPQAFEADIRKALDEGQIVEAQQLVALASEFGHTVPADLSERAQEAPLEFGIRNASEFLKGVLDGDTSSVLAISGSLAADYVGIGDVRDTVTQGALLVRGEEYDQITLGLAVFGLATVLPGTGPLDMTASLFKNANRAKRISQPLRAKVLLSTSQLTDAQVLKASLSELSDKAIRTPSISAATRSLRAADWTAVARGDFASLGESLRALRPVDISAASAAVKKSIRPEKAQELQSLLQSASSVISNGGVAAGFKSMELADDARELSRFGKVASSLGDKTSAALRLLGKNSIKLGKLAYQLAAIFVATTIWLAGLLFFLRDMSHLFWRQKTDI